MTANRRYLRVTNQWTEVLTPGTQNIYVANVSGSTIKMFLSDTSIDPDTITTEFFTIGGCITQVRIIMSKYVYFKASINDGVDTAVVMDYEPIAMTDVDELKNELEKLTLETMYLSKRVTINELKLIRHKIDFKLLSRDWLRKSAIYDEKLDTIDGSLADLMDRMYTAEAVLAAVKAKTEDIDEVQIPMLFEQLSRHANTTNLAIADLDSAVFSIWERIYNHENTTAENFEKVLGQLARHSDSTNKSIAGIDASLFRIWKRLHVAEEFIVKHGNDYKVLKKAVDDLIENSTDVPAEVIVARLAAALERIATIEEGLNSANNEIERLKRNQSVDVDALQNQLNRLDSDFASLNNALVQLSYSYTAEEIEDLFNTLIASVPENMVDAITAIKDDLVRLCATHAIAEALEDGTIVTTENKYIVGDISATEIDNSSS